MHDSMVQVENLNQQVAIVLFERNNLNISIKIPNENILLQKQESQIYVKHQSKKLSRDMIAYLPDLSSKIIIKYKMELENIQYFDINKQIFFYVKEFNKLKIQTSLKNQVW